MSRIYSVTFENVTVTAAQDLLQVKGATGKMLRILRRWVNSVDTTIPTAQMIRLRERFLPATVTDGSGGTSPTPVPHDPGDAAASFTAKANNTTQATSSGTAVVLYATGCHIYNGFDDIHDEPPVIGPSESYVFELLSTVSGTVHLSGGVEVEEIGG
jgi:hypothetical protein